MRLKSVESEEDRLLVKLVTNVCRRLVSSEEKRKMLAHLWEIYLKDGVGPGEIAFKIAEDTRMNYRWTIKYMPAKHKARAGAGGPSKSLSFYELKRKDGLETFTKVKV